MIILTKKTWSNSLLGLHEAMQLSPDQKFSIEVQKRNLNNIQIQSLTIKELDELKSICINLLTQTIMSENVNKYYLDIILSNDTREVFNVTKNSIYDQKPNPDPEKTS